MRLHVVVECRHQLLACQSRAQDRHGPSVRPHAHRYPCAQPPCSPRGGHRAWLAACLQHRLHGRTIDLILPADERTAVVFNFKRPAREWAIKAPRRSTWPVLHALQSRRRAGRRRHGHPRLARPLHADQTQHARAAADPERAVQHHAGRLAIAAGSSASASSTFSISPPKLANVPGHGANARTCRSKLTASCSKSRWPSSRLSLAA